MLNSLMDKNWASSLACGRTTGRAVEYVGRPGCNNCLERSIAAHYWSAWNELSSGIRGQTMCEDMDHPPVASSAMADQAAPLLDTVGII